MQFLDWKGSMGLDRPIIESIQYLSQLKIGLSETLNRPTLRNRLGPNYPFGTSVRHKALYLSLLGCDPGEV